MFTSDVDERRPAGLRARLTHTAALRWYPGALIGLVYQVSVLVGLWASDGTLPEKVLATAILVLVYASFLALPPILWWEGERTRLAAIAAYFALTLLLIPFLGEITCWTWVYVACVIGMVVSRAVLATGLIVALGAVQLVVFLVAGSFEDYWYIALITVSIGVMMSAFARQIDALRRLRSAQSEIARLAVVEERSRFSRDMHDVLGHSLTVVTVKSELARRLVPVDPARAEAELADIERLSRSALADLRAAVAGYREMSISTELAAAQASLAAADITAHLPRNGDEVAPELRELFGWVLREGVTNVIRHSGSRNCWVTVATDTLTIEDDGLGPARGGVAPVGSRVGGGVAGGAGGPGGSGHGGGAGGSSSGGPGGSAGRVSGADAGPDRGSSAVPGSGLSGLEERARAAGATVEIAAGSRGGTVLTVRRTA